MFERIKRRRKPSDVAGNGNVASAPEPAHGQVVHSDRTTSYHQDMDEAPRSAGEPRTTSYRSPSQVSHRGYDSIN